MIAPATRFYITVRVLPKRPNHVHLCKVSAILCYLMRRFHRLTTSEEYTKLTAPAKNYTGLCNKTEYPKLFAPVTAQNLLSPGTGITLNESPSLGYVIMTCIPPERNQDYINPVSHNVPRSPAASYYVHVG
jgi:hypothetical protein